MTNLLDERARPRRIRGLVAAGAAALLAALLAPGGWSTGPGRLVLEVDGRVLDRKVTVGTDEPVLLSEERGDRTIGVELPSGIPVDAPVEATITVAVGTQPVRPALHDVELTLGLPDGTREPIPVLSWNGESGELVAVRHPPQHARTALALLAAAVVLWVTSAIPLFATALAIPVVLTARGIASPVDALAPFFHPIIALFFAGFLLAEAMRGVALDRWAAARLVSAAGRGPVTLFAALMATAAFLSMWMSNTAAVAVLIPIAIAVARPLDNERFTKVVVLGTAYAATVGGVGSAIGTPANMLAIEYLDTFGIRDISFARWFAYGLPLVVVLVPIVGVYLWWRLGVRVATPALADLRDAAREQARQVEFGRRQGRVLVVFLLVAVVWLLETWHGLHPGVVALAAVVLLALTGDVSEEDLGRINWTALLVFGGGLALGLALVETGVADWVASRFGGLQDFPDLAAIALVATATLLLTTVASNTASAATLIPLAIPLAGLLGVDVTVLVLVVAIASSIDFALIIGTPPTMMAFSTGLFRPAEILRAGATLDLVGLALLLTVVIGAWRALGVV